MLNMIEQFFKLIGIGGKLMAQFIGATFGCLGLIVAGGLAIFVGIGALGFIGMLL